MGVKSSPERYRLRIQLARVSGLWEQLPKVLGEDGEVGFGLGDLQECWQSLGGAADGGRYIYQPSDNHNPCRYITPRSQISHRAPAIFPDVALPGRFKPHNACAAPQKYPHPE